jgi:hypothetical protein
MNRRTAPGGVSGSDSSLLLADRVIDVQASLALAPREKRWTFVAQQVLFVAQMVCNKCSTNASPRFGQ